VNVQTVASGTEQLSSSISEIGRQVINSAQIAAKLSVKPAKQTLRCKVLPIALVASAS
jgi:hypothetical protein